ncbi:hypothetical protein EDEG_03994 [Edhazardia aedis USNM 41457]|uniref:Uncharacterized protein n=1 Tax=Edhazardia aedis (strain USNM 41457) TaxID=1003232 RepID=J9DFK2_EDHAE|nr:hypothetical protein EDEG_03994 [Edhazardia aedis USNM 41457]|eukprot:EJW01380.1 hypothetical protein EDEG_03994 [Edhazardia aedis USNM 41457]
MWYSIPVNLKNPSNDTKKSVTDEEFNAQCETLYKELVSSVESVEKALMYIKKLENSDEKIPDGLPAELSYTDYLHKLYINLFSFLPNLQDYENRQIKNLSNQLDNDFNELINSIGSLYNKFYLEKIENELAFYNDLQDIITYTAEMQCPNAQFEENNNIKNSVKKLKSLFKEIDSHLDFEKFIIRRGFNNKSINITEHFQDRITAYNERINNQISLILSFKELLRTFIKKYDSSGENASSNKYSSFRSFIEGNVTKILKSHDPIYVENTNVLDNIVDCLLMTQETSVIESIQQKVQQKLNEYNNSQQFQKSKLTDPSTEAATEIDKKITDSSTIIYCPEKAVEIENLCKLMNNAANIFEEVKNMKPFFEEIRKIHEYFNFLYAKKSYKIFRSYFKLKYSITERYEIQDLKTLETSICNLVVTSFADIFDIIQSCRKNSEEELNSDKT